MKKLLLITAILFFGIVSCQKQELIPKNSNETKGISNYEESKTRNFKHELVIYDDDNKSYIMIALHADDLDVINEFNKNNRIIINPSNTNIEKGVNSIIDNKQELLNNHEVKDDFQGTENQESSLVIEVIKHNFNTTKKHFTLGIESTNNTKSFVPGISITWTANTNTQTHIGAIHNGTGYNNLVRFRYKSGLNLSWKHLSSGGFNAWYITPGSSSYFRYWWYEYSNPRKVEMIVQSDNRQTGINYYVIYSLDANNAYSKECPIGNYNNNNYAECYYGTVPVGTNAFDFNYGGSGGTWFLYTPINGNVCPWLPEVGSGFDGAHCKVVKIPNDAVGKQYVWQRDLLIKSYKLSEL
ncbi:hypothetical protein [Brumimicrobium mesophilum]|uniref:hypothetical protein n=1 Tax=Brumimicrobium mesophilum TaxID=392717 RepID=UPI000D143ABC|nr:hypothetical protein [Brumimicrobium mesophilum]